MNQGIALVAYLDQFAELAIFGLVGLGIRNHTLDLIVVETGRCLDDDFLLPARRLVPGRDIQDPVRIDIEGHFDLRHPPRRRRNFREVEPAQGLVVLRTLPLALKHMDRHRGLVILRGGEHLVRLGGDGGVLVDQARHHAAQGFDTQGQRRHVEQKHVLHVPGKHARLDGRTHGDRLVRIDVLAGLLAEEIADLFLDFRHANLPAHQDHVVHIGYLQPGILQRDPAGIQRETDQVLDHGFELRPGEIDVQMLRPAGIRRDIGQIDLGLLPGGQLDLRLLRGFLEPLHGQRIPADIDAAFLLELRGQVVDDALVEVLAAEEGVAVGRQHLELVLAVDLGNLDDRNVEGAAAQVVYRHLAVAAALVEPIRQRRRRGLVDDSPDFQPGDSPGILGGLALGIVEVRRHGDDGFGHRLAQVVFRRLLHLRQHARGHLRRRHALVAGLDPGVAVVRLDDLVRDHLDVLLHHAVGKTAPDQPLDGEQRVGGIGHRLALRRLADQHLAVLRERHHRGRRSIPLAVLDHPRAVAVHDGNAGIGGSQVNTDHSSHDFRSPHMVSYPALLLAGSIHTIQGITAGYSPFSAGSPATTTRAARSSRSWME